MADHVPFDPYNVKCIRYLLTKHGVFIQIFSRLVVLLNQQTTSFATKRQPLHDDFPKDHLEVQDLKT